MAERVKRIKELEDLRLKAELKHSRAPLINALLDSHDVDKIIRYESSIERQLYRALNQLERLQRQRAGDNVPPPINVEVSEGV